VITTFMFLDPSGSATPDERHGRSHYRHELNIRLQWEAGHKYDRTGNIHNVHGRLGPCRAVRLLDALDHRSGHVGRRVADIDLATGDALAAAFQ
jgi:hypothetical protein